MANSPAPFGTYALKPWRELVRRGADSMPSGRLGIWSVSLMRRASLLGHSRGMRGPHDISVVDGVNARLYPGSNRCEKRGYAGVHLWDLSERNSLEDAIKAHKHDRPFVFLDVGANVGLYSLFVHAFASNAGKDYRIIAIEPDPENRSRLEFNCQASNCDLQIDPVGIAHQAGTGYLTQAKNNRGTVAVAYSGSGVEVELITLSDLIERHELDQVDALKIDIEGRDASALRAMTEQAPKSVWPKLIIVEIKSRTENPILDYLAQHGYRLRHQAKTNAILELDGDNSEAVESA
ncbi:MAG: FkbM family methyltransferase [Rhizobiaceae bacterium]|nr:FkbM family methyltransferase [Rhizobiaceae bacterium]